MTHSISAGIASIATACPPHRLAQTDALAITDRLFADRYDEFERLKPIFTNSGIEHRHIAMPVDWYLDSQNWSGRTETYIQAATELFIQSATLALNKAEMSAGDIDGVVTVSSTGIATPALDARAAESLGLRENIFRVPVFGHGCAGGVAGLSLASKLAAVEPGSRILLVVIELCSLSFRLDKLNKANIVATALFGDGAAAAVLTADTNQPVQISPGIDHTWPKTLDVMGWSVDPIGFEVIFDRSIPPFARRKFPPVMGQFLETLKLSASEIARYSFHPGGAKVIEAFESGLGLQTGTLDLERDVLREHGNMSAPTALFVLERALQRGVPGVSLLSALGPGFTATTVPLRCH